MDKIPPQVEKGLPKNTLHMSQQNASEMPTTVSGRQAADLSHVPDFSLDVYEFHQYDSVIVKADFIKCEWQ